MKSKGLLVLFILCSILLLVSSCKKNTDQGVTETASSKASEVVQAEKETVTEKKAEEKTAQVKADESSNAPEKTTAEVKVEKAEEVKTEESVADEKTVEPVVTETAQVLYEEPSVTVETVVIAEEPSIALAEEEKAEESSSIDVIYQDTLTYKGLTTDVTVSGNEATLSLPENFGLEEVQKCASVINEVFPVEASLVTYSLVGDTLVLTYPEQTEEFLILALNTLREEAMAVIDSIYEEVVEAAEEVSGEVVSASEEEKTETAATEENKDGFFLSFTYSYGGYTTDITVSPTEATLTVPEGLGYELITAVSEYVVSSFPAEAALIAYGFDGNKVVLTYPEQTEEYIIAILPYVEEKVIDYFGIFGLESEAEVEKAIEEESVSVSMITEPVKESEEAVALVIVAEEPAIEEEGKTEEAVYSDTLAYNGLSTKLEVYTTHASLTIPAGVTAEDILRVVEMINSSYRNEASLVTYSISGDTVVLTYPEQTEEFLLLALDVLRNQAMAYIDSLAQKTAVEAVPEAASVTETAAASEKEKVTEAATAPETEKVTETASAPEKEKTTEAATVPEKEKVTETVVSAEEGKKTEQDAVPSFEVSPVSVPVVSNRAEKALRFSVAAVAVPKFNLNGGWANPFVAGFGLRAEMGIGSFAFGLKGQYDLSSYILAEVYGRWNFICREKVDFYALAGLGAAFGVGANSSVISFVSEVGAGAEWKAFSHVAFFGEVTGQWSVSKPGFEIGATVGVKANF